MPFCMPFVCHSHVLVCHSYVTCMHSYVIRMSLAYTHMSFVCYSYVLVCMSSVCHLYEVLPWTFFRTIIFKNYFFVIEQLSSCLKISLYFIGEKKASSNEIGSKNLARVKFSHQAESHSQTPFKKKTWSCGILIIEK